MQKAKNILFFFTLALLSVSAQSAFPWSDMGHKIVGEVAEQTIQPQTRNFIRGILGIESLAAAAIWPDIMRDDKNRFAHQESDPDKRDADNFDFGPYHFCEIPTGFDYNTKPKKVVKDCHGAIVHAGEILKDTSEKYSREAKMIALRYLVHVIGDIHQPLHIGNGFDMGGNMCQIYWQKTSSSHVIQTNLHSVWDDLLVQHMGESYGDSKAVPKKPAARYLSDYISGLKQRYADWFTTQAKDRQGSTTLEQWMQESQHIRENGLYPDDPALMANVKKGEEYKNRPYCLWFADQEKQIKGPDSQIDESKIPTLDAKYGDRFKGIVETQLLKGGLRLAATLDQIAATVAKAKTPPSMIDDKLQTKILTDVQNAFRNTFEDGRKPSQSKPKKKR